MISIIIPIYNSEPFLERCIRSVAAQDYPHFDLLLIDDGSTDAGPAICDRWARKDSRIRVFHSSNGGQSSARNLGLDHASGEYITFIDSDDYVTPDYLSCLLSLFGSESHCSITACNHFIIRKGSPVPHSEETGIRTFSAKSAMENALFHGCIDVAPWGKLYRKEVFSGLRYPEGRIFEDTWLFGDLIRNTEQLVYSGKCCYYYEIRENSTARKPFSPASLQYIEAAQKMAADALAFGPDLRTGGIRRINHARLSVLRSMGRCEAQYRPLRKTIRADILKDAAGYIHDPRTPKRDRMAIALLRIGLPAYHAGWSIYESTRSFRVRNPL